ncbi:MAG TPA: AAA family ATPase [Streptosporangiaceae bacterium]|jgi:DNA-binding CsgD family transcriptional regulator/tetratricopeptide (TPR) repeat protein
MRLLERDPLLASLRQYAREAGQGEGRLVLIAGEAGAGKSVLVEQSQRELPGARWSWGACDGLSTPRPLAPLFDLARDLGGTLEDLCQGRPDRDQLFAALLRQVTGSDRLDVIVIEDIHWADEATLDLLRFLTRRIRAAPVLVLATYRDDRQAPSSPLRLALGDLAARRWTRRLELPPLSVEAVRTMAAGTGLDADQLYQLAGGNPFYVTEMLEAGTPGVPLSARDAILSRTGRLSSAARQVLETAALMGLRIDPGLLSARQAELDELTSSGLLADDGTGLRFRHEIARLAIAQEIPARRQAVIHAGILAALLASGSGDDARMAFHAEGAGQEEAVVRHASLAARRAVDLGSHREAAAQYERALRWAAHATPPALAELYSGLAEEATLSDRSQAAADADEQALRLWRQLEDRRREGESLQHYSLTLKHLCRGEEAVAAAVQAISTLEPLGETRELARAYATLAAVRMTRNETGEAIVLARRAAALARPLDAADVIADALNTEGCAAAATDPGWVELIRRSLELALSRNLPNQAGRAYSNLYGISCDQFRFDEGEQYYRAGLAYCEQHDLDTHAYFLRACRTAVLEHRGSWDEAMAISAQLLEESSAAPLNQICVQTLIGVIRARRGEPGAWPALDNAVASAVPTAQPQYVVPARLARTEAFLTEGRADEARREAELAADAAQDIDEWLRGALRRWLRRAGSGRIVDGPVADPWQLEESGRHAAAARAWDELGCRLDAALALLDSPDEADLRDALRRLDELGARATAGLARHKLRQIGARSVPAGPRRATRAHPDGLTPRECEVLELICQRKTNAQIARTLFISARTVDHHVSAVLAKLGVESREAAADRNRNLPA